MSKKEDYIFILENKTGSNKERFTTLGTKEVNVYFGQFGETSEYVELTNKEIIDTLSKEHTIGKRIHANVVELVTGDCVGWQPVLCTNY